jgi:DNA-binding NtrC family response regulator
MDVLIVERDELFAEVLSDALSADGISVAIVPNEEEAMRACRDGSPRVVITGINRRSEDMKGLYFARAMPVHCPWLTLHRLLVGGIRRIARLGDGSHRRAIRG